VLGIILTNVLEDKPDTLMGNGCLEGEKKSIFVKFDDDELKYENQQTSRMSADSSMGAHTSNTVDTTSQNDINDAAWNPVGDSPLIAPVLATMEVPPIEPVEPVAPVAPVELVAAVETVELEAPDENPSVQEVLSTSNLHVEIPESSESDDDMPPLISSSDEESESDSKESDDSKEESDDSKDDSKDDSDSKESDDDSKEESDDSKEESDDSDDDSKESDEDLMVAVFQRPTCPRCDAALMALLTPSEESESESSDSSGSDSRRVHRIRPKPTEIPTIILTLFKILLFLHIVQFLTTSIAPARRTYS
jgi:hypothetical protein